MNKWFLGLMSMLCMSGIAYAAVAYKEKIHYELVQPAQPTSTKEKIEVVEMFWYGCPHCFNLEPFVHRWLESIPKEAEFVRMPAIFRPAWETHARAYYTAEILGVLDKTHQAMFDAIHMQKRNLDTNEAIADFFAEHGVKKEEFERVFKSFAVEAKVRRAKDMSQRYGIKGVPALIVNGKYRTAAQEAGGNANIFKVVNFLVDKEVKGN